MFTAHHISKAYNLDTILEDVSFSIGPGERVGLIGPNGCGKTTLLRILAGEETPDQGSVALTPASLRLGYLPQGMIIDPRKRLEQVLTEATGDAPAAEAQVARLATALAQHPGQPALQNAYDQALLRLENAQQVGPGEAASTLAALGLADIDPAQPIGQMSGGQKTRLALALVLLSQPQLLLLDEPTNHLDIGMLEWLEAWLERYPGAALIVSHDRTFLDHTVTRILDLDPEAHRLREYSGNYSDYLEQYLAERERQASAYRDQVDEIRRMRRDIQRTKQQALNVELSTTSRQPGVRRVAKKVAKKAKSREKKLDRYLESDERLEKPLAGWQMKLEFGSSPGEESQPRHLGRDVCTTSGLVVGYEGYPPLLENLNLQVRAKRRIVFTGPNGAGKTSLLRTLAGRLPPLAGRVHLGASVKLGYMTQEQEALDPALNAVEAVQRLAALNETEVRSFLHYFLFSGDDALRPAGQLSYGERARLMLATLVVSGCNLLLLDEPINHLDIPSRSRFEQALSGFEGAILAVVHDRYFIERFATDLWVIEGRGVRHEVLAA
ncbi:MAG: ribosomal protection-like ABC-F family protein [Chloroflexota bacterium]